MKKKCRVIMLPANEESNIQITNNISKYTNRLFCRNIEDIPEIGFTNQNQNQYLYFLNNDEICGGDIGYISIGENGIIGTISYDKTWNLTTKEGIIYPYPTQEYILKVIASTDSSLNLPKPSDQFLQVYIDSFNKNEKIEECLVEYEENKRWLYTDEFGKEHGELKLKVTKGEITIRLIKDSWNKKELSDVLNLYLETGFISKECGYMNPEEWINQNL